MPRRQRPKNASLYHEQSHSDERYAEEQLEAVFQPTVLTEHPLGLVGVDEYIRSRAYLGQLALPLLYLIAERVSIAWNQRKKCPCNAEALEIL